jgi:hypothetical protein
MAETTTSTDQATNGSGPATTASSGVQRRVERLRELSASDPVAAQADAWAWFTEVGRRVTSGDRDEAVEELQELFESGRPSTGIDGPTEGMLVAFTTQPVLDKMIAAITAAWLPWAGKTFNTETGQGRNLLLRSARLPSRLPWPTYSMASEGDYAAGFDFTTYVEPGALDPDVDVLVIDYASVEENPRVLIKSIRDELVEIVPGAHLGKMLWIHRGGERHSLLAYFALKSSV